MTPVLLVLTDREEAVLALIADGLSYHEIGVRLAIQPSTVRHHRDNARVKLGAASTAHAVALLIRARTTEQPA